jgi:hypothetical protein
MKNIIIFLFFILISLNIKAQYAPDADTHGTTAIYKDSSIIVAWASGYKDTIYGEDVDEKWKTPEKALGKAEGTSGDIVCLGRGGQITFTFDSCIYNGEGVDFVTFENGFSNTFLELGWIEVSYDGIHFERFPNYSLTKEPVDAYGDIDPTKINGYCSKYRQGYGTPFDLDSVNLDTIRYIKFIDITGDGSCVDSQGHVIYDPYKTSGSAGLDIDAIGVIHMLGKYMNVTNIQKTDILIYPNPASNYINIKTDGNDIQSINIYDITGKVIYHKDGLTKKLNIDISYLKEGIYFINIRKNTKTINKKLIIKR